MRTGSWKLLVKNFSAQGLNTLLGLVFTIAGARLMSLADYGELRYMMTLLPLLMACTLPGFDSIILRKANLREQVPLRNIFYIRLVTGCVGALSVSVALYFFSPALSASLKFLLLITALLLPFFETATGYKNYLIGIGLRNQSLNLVFFSRLTSMLLFLLLGLLIYSHYLSPLWIYPSYLLAIILPTIWTFSLIARKIRHAENFFPIKWHALILPAAVSTIASLTYTYAYSMDKLWIRNLSGAQALAIYSILVMVPQELAKLCDTSFPLYYKRLFFDRNTEKRKIHIGRAFFSLLTAIVVLLLYANTFKFFSPWIFGEKYSYPFYLCLLSGMLIFGQAFEYFNSHKIFAHHGSRGQFIYTLLNLALCSIFIPIGIKLGGLSGLLLALLFKQLLLPIFYYSGVSITSKLHFDSRKFF